MGEMLTVMWRVWCGNYQIGYVYAVNEAWALHRAKEKYGRSDYRVEKVLAQVPA